ncbi:MAG: hypothetical protein AAF721_00300 [Myxococcota bacterium]
MRLPYRPRPKGGLDDNSGSRHCARERCGWHPVEAFEGDDIYCRKHRAMLDRELERGERPPVYVGFDDPATARAHRRLAAQTDAVRPVVR